MVAVDLAEAGVRENLREQVLDAHWFTEWRTGDAKLALACDSLDEAPEGATSVGKHLARRLAELPRERLVLRIACRTALWPERLTEELGSPAVLELLPLRRCDVWAAAEARGIDAAAFLQAVIGRSAQALASRPLTLEMLLAQFAAGRFPSTRVDLYQQGLGALCEETPARRTGEPSRRLSGAQRLAVAERIAACCLLSGQSAVSLGDAANPELGLHESELLGGLEGSGASCAEVALPAVVRETLNTGLFTSRGSERFGFGHHSYAEFLAASWLAHRHLTLEQVHDLIGVPESATPTIAPQWHGLAAWLASMHPEFLDVLLHEQPEILVDADAGAVPRDRTPDLLRAYLRRLDTSVVPYPGFRVEPLFQGLDAPAAEAPLRACITDNGMREATRRLAIEIARDLKCNALVDDLVPIALDAGAPAELRADAAYTIYRIGDSLAKARLKPLLLPPAKAAVSDELYGAALCCCWPEHMSCDELLAALRPRQDPHTFGLYSRFLDSEETVAAMLVAAVPRVLEWLARQPADATHDDFETLREHVIVRAAEHLDDPRVAKALAAFAIQRIRQHADVWERRTGTLYEGRPDPFAEPLRRRRLMRAVVAQLTRELHRGYLRRTSSFVRADDIDWLLKRVVSVTDEHRWAWLRLTDAAFQYHDIAHWGLLLDAQARESRLREWLAQENGWRPQWDCSLDPEDADILRVAAGLPPRGEEHQRELREAERREKARTDALAGAIAGDAARWDRFVDLASNHTATTVVDTEFWTEATPELRRRILDAALVYLAARELPEWVVKRAIQEKRLEGGAFQTFAALKVVATVEPKRLRVLSADRWPEWLPIILWFAGLERDNAMGTLLNEAFTAAGDVARDTLLQVVRHDAYPPFDAIEPHWDPALSDALLRYVVEARDKAPSLRPILERLLRRGVDGARELVISLVRGHSSDDPDEQGASVAAAHALVVTTGASAWPVLGPILASNPAWGVRVLVDHDWQETLLEFGNLLADAELAELVGWCIDRFPPERDAKGVSVGPPVEYLRNRMIETLKQRGTDEACAGLQVLEHRFPQYPWLRQVRLEAEALRAQSTWRPTPPDQLLRMATDRRLRRIESGKQLLELLVESLTRLAERLHGTTPAVRFLWHTSVPGRWRPRGEEDFSEWVEQHLKDDLGASGIIVNREVQIRRRTYAGGQAGQRTDIRVDLGASGDSAGVTAFIEVKGSWNGSAPTAMETQLVNRYLRESQCRHGLYLMAWCHCDGWTETSDSRRRQQAFASIEECRARLATQATELSARPFGETVVAHVLDCRLR